MRYSPQIAIRDASCGWRPPDPRGACLRKTGGLACEVGTGAEPVAAALPACRYELPSPGTPGQWRPHWRSAGASILCWSCNPIKLPGCRAARARPRSRRRPGAPPPCPAYACPGRRNLALAGRRFETTAARPRMARGRKQPGGRHPANLSTAMRSPLTAAASAPWAARSAPAVFYRKPRQEEQLGPRRQAVLRPVSGRERRDGNCH